ncbi:unnamed protein product, partial [Symbiodinium microadriaticum]
KGDYQKFMAQYAQDFQNYLQGQGKSANGNGDYQKYMSDFQQYMKGQGGSHGDYQKYMSMYAADFDKYQKQYTNGQGGKQGDYTQFMAQYGQGADAEGDYQKYMSGYQQYMQGQGGQGKGATGDYQKYMSDFQQYMKGHGGSQGDYQKFMSQYASDFQKYMQGQGKSGAGAGAGDYQKYMSDFQQYMKGHGGSQGDYQKFMSQYASDFQKYMQGQGSGAAGDYQKYMSDYQQYMQGHGGSQGDYQKFMSQYASDYMQGQGKGGAGAGDYKKYMSDFQQYTKGHGGSQGDYQKFMSQYASDFQKYMQGQGKGGASAGDYQKYMSDYQKYMQGHGGSQGDYQKFMSQYASDFQKYMQGQGKGAASAGDYEKYMSDFQQYMKGQGSQGGYQKFMSQYSSDFQKYMQGQGKGAVGDYQKYMSDFQQYMKGQGGSQGSYDKYMQYKQYMQGQGKDTKASKADHKHIAQGSHSHSKHEAKDKSSHSKDEAADSKDKSKDEAKDKDAPAAFVAAEEGVSGESNHLLFAPVLLVAVAASAFVYMQYQKRSLSSRTTGEDYVLQLEPMNAAAGISQFPGFAGASAQQPAQQAVPSQPASQAPVGPVECVGQTAHLTVSGCTHGTVGGIVRGNFTANGQNHGKPTYKKDHQVNGLDVMLYYWDERDGPNFCGWWFGPKVGGDQVWAYHPSRQSLTPPTKGWKVPYDGPVDDSFSICPTSLANANAAQQNYPQGFQQAPGKGGGYQAPGAYAGQQPGPGAGGKGSYGNMPQNDQQRHELQAQNRRQHEQRRAMQRREEEMRQQQQAEAMRKAAEQKMQMEEEQRRVAEQKRKEQEACSSIRAVCQRMRMVQEESFPQLQQELYDVMQRELNNCGMQMAKIREECDQIVDQARRRLQEAAEVKAFQEKKKAEMLEAHKVACAKAEQLVADFTAKVEAAEEAANALVEKAEPFTSDEGVMNLGSEDKILEEASKIDEARDEAAARTAECQEYLKENRSAMTIQDMPGHPPAEVKQVLAKVMDRLTETAKKKDGVMVKIMVVKSKAMRRSKAKKTLEDRKAKFTKYAKDGVLDKKQVTAYCKKEFNLALKEDAVARIFKALQVTKGVAAADFQRLRVQIGIIRESIKDQARLKLRLEREKELEASKEEVREKIEELTGKADEVEAPVKQVEDAILELSKVDKDSTRASQMHEKCAEVFPRLAGIQGEASPSNTFPASRPLHSQISQPKPSTRVPWHRPGKSS